MRDPFFPLHPCVLTDGLGYEVRLLYISDLRKLRSFRPLQVIWLGDACKIVNWLKILTTPAADDRTKEERRAVNLHGFVRCRSGSHAIVYNCPATTFDVLAAMGNGFNAEKMHKTTPVPVFSRDVGGGRLRDFGLVFADAPVFPAWC